MAARKTPSTAPGTQTEDLTSLKLPGGGVARWFKPSELTPRRERSLTVLNAHLMPKFKQAFDAAGITDTSKVGPFDVALSVEDTEKILELQELTVIAYLKSWTRKEPLPVDADALLDLPKTLYTALVAHASKIQASNLVDTFTVDGVEDPDSPTGGSGD